MEQFAIPFVKGQETFKEIYTEDELKALLETPNMKDFVTTRTHNYSRHIFSHKI